MFDPQAVLKDQLHERFLRACELDPITECWIWTGAWQKESGLGVLKVQGKLYTAHRVALWVYRGGFDLCDTRGARVYHSHPDCESPACCAPEHLSIASSAAAVNTALAILGRFTRKRPCNGTFGNVRPMARGA